MLCFLRKSLDAVQHIDLFSVYFGTSKPSSLLQYWNFMANLKRFKFHNFHEVQSFVFEINFFSIGEIHFYVL